MHDCTAERSFHFCCIATTTQWHIRVESCYYVATQSTHLFLCLILPLFHATANISVSKPSVESSTLARPRMEQQTSSSSTRSTRRPFTVVSSIERRAQADEVEADDLLCRLHGTLWQIHVDGEARLTVRKTTNILRASDSEKATQPTTPPRPQPTSTQTPSPAHEKPRFPTHETSIREHLHPCRHLQRTRTQDRRFGRILRLKQAKAKVVTRGGR